MWCAWRRRGELEKGPASSGRRADEDLFFVDKAGSSPMGVNYMQGLFKKERFLQRKSVFDFLFYSVGRWQIVIGVN